MSEKEPGAFRTIGEVATELDLPQHVLRFWETKFSQIRPTKRSSGRRFYRPEDVALVRTIRDMLYAQGYTIRGVQRVLKERGVRSAATEVRVADPAPEPHEQRVEPPEAETLDTRPPTAPITLPEDAARPMVSPAVVDQMRALIDGLQECTQILAVARRVAQP